MTCFTAGSVALFGQPRLNQGNGTTKSLEKPISYGLIAACPDIGNKYVEEAKKMTINVFNRSGYQESVNSLGLNSITSNELSLVEDPAGCQEMVGYLEYWTVQNSIFKKVFLKINSTNYYLIVWVPESLFGHGTTPIHLLTNEFEPKAVWLY